MDYEKKYLKYKIKYNELKKLASEQEGGYPWSKKEPTSKDVLKNHNKLLEKELNIMLSKLKNTIGTLTNGLSSSQKNEVLEEYNNQFSEKNLFNRRKDGEFRKHIKNNQDRTVRLKDLLEKHLNNNDLSLLVREMIENNIKNIYNTLAQIVPNIAKQNPETTSESIILMTQQINLNKICESKNIKVGHPECTKASINTKMFRLSNFKKEVIVYHNKLAYLDKNLLKFNSYFEKLNELNKSNKQEVDDDFKKVYSQLKEDLLLLLCQEISPNVSNSECNEAFIYNKLLAKYIKENDTNNKDFKNILEDVLGNLPEGLNLDDNTEPKQSPKEEDVNQYFPSSRSYRPTKSQSYTSPQERNPSPQEQKPRAEEDVNQYFPSSRSYRPTKSQSYTSPQERNPSPKKPQRYGTYF